MQEGKMFSKRKKLKEAMEMQRVSDKKKRKIMIGTVFVILILLVGNYYLFGSPSLTGRVVQNIIENGIQIESETTVPNLEIKDQDLGRLRLEGDSKSSFIAGDSEYEFKELEDIRLELIGFAGDLEIDSNSQVRIIDGSTDKVLVNGISVYSPESGKKLQVKFNGKFLIDSLRVDDVFIKELSYKTYGDAVVGRNKTRVEFNNEELFIKNYKGPFDIIENRFFLNGVMERLKVSGKKSEVTIGI